MRLVNKLRPLPPSYTPREGVWIASVAILGVRQLCAYP